MTRSSTVGLKMRRFWKNTKPYIKPASFVFAITLLAGGLFTISLPEIYRSSATILVADENAASAAIDSGSTGFADRRIEILRKRVLSTTNLNLIARDLQLYSSEHYLPDGRLKSSILNKFREDIEIRLVKVKAADSKVRFAIESAIAFDLSYDHQDPATAQRVTSRLLEIILAENNSSGTKPGDATETLLSTRSNEIERRLKQAETELSSFKEQNVYSLPDLKESNLRTLDKTQDGISDTRLQIRAARDQLIYLESELVRLKPYAISFDSEGNRVLGASDLLKSLRAELASKRARYSGEHPDIVKLNDEIRSLRQETSSTPAVREINAEIAQLRARWAEMSNRYSSDHPSMTAINRQLDSLERELSREQRRPRGPVNKRDADNPAYISTAAQLNTAKLEINELQDRLSKLHEKRAIYEKRVEESPLVESYYNELVRNFEQLESEYTALREKSFAAELSGSLKESNYKQGLVILEPANFPESPYKPNRKILALLTLFLASWAAVGTAFLLRQFDDRIWLPEHLMQTVGTPPLGVIPNYNSHGHSKLRTNQNPTEVAVS